MDELICEHQWQLDESRIVKPFRRYKAMRNNSMPDLTEFKPPHAQRQFIYNKWYIKPEERLKRNLPTARSSMQLDTIIPYFYESLYNKQLQTRRPAKESRQKQTAIRRICADGQNLKLLATFRNRKQQNSKRVPAVVDYIMDFQKRQQQQIRQRLAKTKRHHLT